MRNLYEGGGATWFLLRITFYLRVYESRLIRNNLKWINLALTLQILDYSTDILEFNTMPMSLLIRLDFSFSLEERNVENFQQ